MATASKNSESELREFLRTASLAILSDQRRLDDLVKAKTKNIVSYSILEGRVDLLFRLLSYGSLDVNELDELDKTPLFHATEQCDYGSFILLLHAGADPRITGIKNSRNFTPLHYAVKHKMNFFVYSICVFTKNTTYATEIMDAEIKVFLYNTPLQFAIRYDNIIAANIICASGADVNKDALQYATYLKKKEFIKLLLSYGADPRKANKQGKTSLDLASSDILPLLTSASSASLVASANIDPAPLKYIFSQRGVTCGTDSIFTIFFNADPFGKDFQDATLSDSLFPSKPSNVMTAEHESRKKEIKEETNRSGLYGIDKELFRITKMLELPPISYFDDTLFYAFKRYRKMKGLEAAATGGGSATGGGAATGNRVRRASLNEGEGTEILKCITGRSDFGTYFHEATDTIERILIKNSYGILKKDYNLKHVSYKLSREDPDIPSMDKVCAILLGFNSPDPSKVGHSVSILKIDGEWYYGDNEVGYLHKFKDPSFMTSFYNGMRSRCTLKNNALLILPSTLSTGTPDFKAFIFHSEGIYPPNPQALTAEFLFGGLLYALEYFDIIYQEPPVTVASAERRGRTRRISRQRQQRPSRRRLNRRL